MKFKNEEQYLNEDVSIKIINSLKNLRKDLEKEYPSEHWNHVSVWTAFWDFVEAIDPKYMYKL